MENMTLKENIKELGLFSCKKVADGRYQRYLVRDTSQEAAKMKPVFSGVQQAARQEILIRYKEISFSQLRCSNPGTWAQRGCEIFIFRDNWKIYWKKPRATGFTCPCFEQEVVLDTSRGSPAGLNYPLVLWQILFFFFKICLWHQQQCLTGLVINSV